jgi:hypothetical protein
VPFFPPTLNFRTALTAAWIFASLLTLFVLTLPLIFWRRHRIKYATVLSSVLLLGTTAIWLFDWSATDELQWMFVENSATAVKSQSLFIESQRGVIAFTFIDDISHVSDDLGIYSSLFHWTRHRLPPTFAKYPRFAPPPGVSPIMDMKCGDFELAGCGQPDLFDEPLKPGEPKSLRRQRSVARRHLWLFSIPDWFVILIVSILPVRFIYGRIWGVQKFRRRHNLCQNCGYSLQGLMPVNANSVRCPECGTYKSQPIA